MRQQVLLLLVFLLTGATAQLLLFWRGGATILGALTAWPGLWLVYFLVAHVVTERVVRFWPNRVRPIGSVDEGILLLEAFQGRPEEFRLPVPKELLDPVGVNMAVITDRALARGWQPDGFTEQPGVRVFRYKELR